ncbi:MAG: hypothetical protein ABII89_06695 [Candidatus Omnitrophota bacterium]
MPVLKKEQIVDEWSLLIRGAQGKAGYIFGNTGNLIDQTGVPDVNVEKSKLALSGSIFGKLFGAKRDCLTITNTENPKLRPYQMFISARDYGNNLDISWYLTYRLSFWQKLTAFFASLPLLGLLFISEKTSNPRIEWVPNLNLFDEQDLRVYVTNAHHCLLDAVDKLMLELNQDPSKIDRKSRGFLGIS